MGDLYRMYGRDNRLLYIGISGHAGARASQHAEDKPWWPLVVRIDIEHVACSRDQLLAYEKRCIQTEQPAYNIQHNGRDPDAEGGVVRPYFVPRHLAASREWKDLTRALANLVPYVRQRTSAATLGEATVTTEGGDVVSLLGLIDSVARAAHLVRACSQCGSDTVPFYVSISKEGTPNANIRTSSTCTTTDCHGWQPTPQRKAAP